MDPPRITVELDQHEGPFWPGDVLAGRYRIDSTDPDDVRAVELSVLWHTVGKGEEDLAVHFFERHSVDDAGASSNPSTDFRRGGPFQVTLPKSPFSYDGIIVKIRWCVRLRVFRARGRELLAERMFQLGAVPPARAVAP